MPLAQIFQDSQQQEAARMPLASVRRARLHETVLQGVLETFSTSPPASALMSTLHRMPPEHRSAPIDHTELWFLRTISGASRRHPGPTKTKKHWKPKGTD